MQFFGRPVSNGKIKIDTTNASSDSPEIKKRLDRISDNYQKLDVILSDLETRFETDERLKTTFEMNGELEGQDSVDPQKPR